MKTKKNYNTEGSFKLEYLQIIAYVIFYFFTSFLLKKLATEDETFQLMHMLIESSVLRGIIIQLQMLASLFLVLKGNRHKYLTALVMNIYCILVSSIFLIQSPSSLPGIVAYFGIIIIISIVRAYEKETTAYIGEIEKNKNSLEESEKRLHYMAFYDPLTELPNKALFMNRLEQSIHLAKRNSTLIGVNFIDLDTFKSVNDTMGHIEGDNLLKEIARRLSTRLRKEDTISRFGGDEFLLQVVNLHKVQDVNTVVQKVMNSFDKPFIIQNIEFFVSASVGVSVFPVDGEDAHVLIKNADIAMYSAKNNGKNRFVYCSTELKNDVIKQMILTNKLYRALNKNEFLLYFQPQVKTATKEIVGFEALLRWHNSEFGVISPNVFIPLAEKTGLIKPIGLWVIKTVCEQCKKCRNQNGKNYRISINVTLEQLKDINIVNEISTILKDTDADKKNIQIEITESIAFNEEPFVLKRLLELKELGLSIAIDDFGTGFSSLSRLKSFPIDLIKIDKEFIQGISTGSKKDKAIIKGTIQLAKNLGIEVLAEGVETHEQFMFLKEAECDEIQGYYFHKPLLPDEVKLLLD
ncbi:MAG: EAL domain-containing protein [Crenarchaeota archaeon]|nr:EAL domain-containing protein [Thermoproteota archaeon]